MCSKSPVFCILQVCELDLIFNFHKVHIWSDVYIGFYQSIVVCFLIPAVGLFNCFLFCEDIFVMSAVIELGKF